VLYEIAKTADVFLTNYMPAVRQKNKFDVEHIRAVNPKIIYARGSAYGDKGPQREVGGFDGTAFWTRSGIGHALTPAELGGALSQGIPAFGDSIGGMNIAGASPRRCFTVSAAARRWRSTYRCSARRGGPREPASPGHGVG